MHQRLPHLDQVGLRPRRQQKLLQRLLHQPEAHQRPAPGDTQVAQLGMPFRRLLQQRAGGIGASRGPVAVDQLRRYARMQRVERQGSGECGQPALVLSRRQLRQAEGRQDGRVVRVQGDQRLQELFRFRGPPARQQPVAQRQHGACIVAEHGFQTGAVHSTPGTAILKHPSLA